MKKKIQFKRQFINQHDIFIEKKAPKNKSALPHPHTNIEFIYIISGKTSHTIDNIRYDTVPGDMLISKPGQIHSFSSETPPVYFIITVTSKILQEELKRQKNFSLSDSLNQITDSVTCPFIRFSGEAKKRIEHMIEEMYREINQPATQEQMFILENLLSTFLIYTKRGIENNHQKRNNILSEIVLYIEENFRKKLTLNELAERCCYSPKYFSHVFKLTYGITVTEYIQQKRINEACNLLVETDFPIEKISSEVGYADNTKFFEYFKKLTHSSPKEYRNNNTFR